METKQIIQASANVVRITNLKKGDVYKRMEDTSYSNSVHYGVVVALHNDGSKTFIEAIEYKSGYREIEASRKVFSGSSDVNIFPADPAEIAQHFAESIVAIEKSIADKKDEIAKLELTLERGREFVSGEMAKQLTAPEFKEMTQKEFLVEKRERELQALDQ